jgi:Protein of unknown function (DUF2637)
MVKLIKALSIAIMIAAGVTSYHTQRTIFVDWQVDGLTATIAPISIDLLAIICSVSMHLPNITKAGRVTALCVLVLAGGGSAAANWMAGSTVGSKAVHVGMVVCYLLAETVASQVRSKATATVKVPANAPTSPGQPPLQVDPPEALAFREAQAELRKSSRLASLNT